MQQSIPPSKGLADRLMPLLDADAGELSITPRRSLPHARQTLFDVHLPGQHFIAKGFHLTREQFGPAVCEYGVLQLVALLDLAPQSEEVEATSMRPLLYTPSQVHGEQLPNAL